MSSHVRLSDVVKERIENYRDNHDHSNIDSAIREIMIMADIDVYEYHNPSDEGSENNDVKDDNTTVSDWSDY